MSTERESKIIFGYQINHSELISIMKDNGWNDDYFEENDGYNAMIAEEFSNHYGMFPVSEDNEHTIGFLLDHSHDYDVPVTKSLEEQLKLIHEKKDFLKQLFKKDSDPMILGEIFSW